jgi:biotin operon repressor
VTRSQRLDALVEELIAASPLPRSASWLGARLGVSASTVERDINALRLAGAPILTEPGREGYLISHEDADPDERPGATEAGRFQTGGIRKLSPAADSPPGRGSKPGSPRDRIPQIRKLAADQLATGDQEPPRARDRVPQIGGPAAGERPMDTRAPQAHIPQARMPNARMPRAWDPMASDSGPGPAPAGDRQAGGPAALASGTGHATADTPHSAGSQPAGSQPAGRQPAGSQPGVRQLIEALTDLRVVLLDYRDRHGAVSRRAVEPIGLIRADHGRHWYLIAWCRSRSAVRGFRVDRIAAAEVTDEHFADRDLSLADCLPEETVRGLDFTGAGPT